MTLEEFEAAISKICAAFVFPYPEKDTISAWYQVAGSMTLRASKWVVDEFIRTTGRITRGINLGHELEELNAEYKKNQKAEEFRRQRENIADSAQRCPDCSAGFPGWIRVHVRAHGDEPESFPLYRCACNKDSRFLHKQAWTREQISNFPHMEVMP